MAELTAELAAELAEVCAALTLEETALWILLRALDADEATLDADEPAEPVALANAEEAADCAEEIPDAAADVIEFNWLVTPESEAAIDEPTEFAEDPLSLASDMIEFCASAVAARQKMIEVFMLRYF